MLLGLRLDKSLYFLLLCVRLACTLVPGYIHPDEFFQGGQELFFGCSGDRHGCNERVCEVDATPYVSMGGRFDNLKTTWEFEPQNAIRCVVPPTVMTLIPLRVYSWAKTAAAAALKGLYREFSVHVGRVPWNDELNGWEILIVPRLFLWLLSILTMDLPIWYIVRSTSSTNHNAGSDQPNASFGYALWNSPVPNESIVFASSWPTLVFLVRPFTNTMETFCLSLLFLIVAYDQRCANLNHHKPPFHTYSLIVPLITGLLCSFGIFTRFTFAAFALPSVLRLLHHRGLRNTAQRNYLCSLFTDIFVIATTSLCSAAALALADYRFYDSQQASRPTVQRPWYVPTPFNALSYNTNVDNLSDHGLHPRFTHCLVNMPLLYGPLFLFVCYRLLTNEYSPIDTNYLALCPRSTLCLGLLVLSCAPHQEPRFLLPLLLPLVFLYGDGLLVEKRDAGGKRGQKTRISTKRCFIWVFFNLLLGVFFGYLHQGGVVPSLLALSEIHYTEKGLSDGIGAGTSAAVPKAILVYHTYMPPTFLLRTGGSIAPSDRSELNTCRRSYDAERCGSRNNPSEPTLTQALSSSACDTVPVIDLKGSDLSSLTEQLTRTLKCSSFERTEGAAKEDEENDSDYVYLVSPLAALDPNSCDRQFPIASLSSSLCTFSDVYLCEEVWSRTQVSTEDMPRWCGSVRRFLADTRLSVYRVRCP